MKASDLFPSRFLKAGDFDVPKILIPRSIEMEDVGNGEEKAVLYFRGAKAGLPLNKTNVNILSELFGDDLENCLGNPIELHCVDTEYQGRPAKGIRIRAPETTTKKPPAPTKRNLSDDDIPF